MLTSARRAIPYPNPDRTDRPDIPAHIKNLVDAMELDVVFVQGTEAARAAAPHYTGGGRLWWTTDAKTLWYDDGATWSQLGDQTGDVKIILTNTAPSGWVLCDGMTYDSIALPQYAPLFAKIGTSWGGTGASAFKVPDGRGRSPFGLGTNADVNAIGNNDGEATVANRTPKHHHTVNGRIDNAGSTNPFTDRNNTGTLNLIDTSGGGMLDAGGWFVVNFAVKL